MSAPAFEYAAELGLIGVGMFAAFVVIPCLIGEAHHWWRARRAKQQAHIDEIVRRIVG